MILVDTSVLVEYLRATGSSAHLRLRALLEGGAALATTDPVVMEILAGATSEGRAEELARFMAAFDHVPVVGPGDYEDAAWIYRTCRAGGTPVRSIVDCLVASVALRAGLAVLSHDRDYVAIAERVPLELAG